MHLVWVESVCFFISLSWRVITRGKLFRTLKLHGSPVGCFSRWMRVGFPWQLDTAWGRMVVHLARKRPVRPSSGLANSLWLTVPWVDHAGACIGESCWIPSVCKTKGVTYTPICVLIMPLERVHILNVFLESHWLVLKIHVNLYIFIFSKCVVITP